MRALCSFISKEIIADLTALSLCVWVCVCACVWVYLCGRVGHFLVFFCSPCVCVCVCICICICPPLSTGPPSLCHPGALIVLPLKCVGPYVLPCTQWGTRDNRASIQNTAPPSSSPSRAPKANPPNISRHHGNPVVGMGGLRPGSIRWSCWTRWGSGTVTDRGPTEGHQVFALSKTDKRTLKKQELRQNR